MCSKLMNLDNDLSDHGNAYKDESDFTIDSIMEKNTFQPLGKFKSFPEPLSRRERLSSS